MPAANITINGTPGSNTNLPIGTLVQLNNLNVGGELTYLWTILDQPPGPADVLSSTVIQNPTFTPRKEGTYLIQLVINQSMPSQIQQTVVGAVLQLITQQRVPASGETTQADPTEGWGLAAGNFLRLVDSARAQSGHIVGVASTNGLVPGNILRINGVSTIKSGLPGETTLPSLITALATSSSDITRTLVILQQGVNGSLTPSMGDLINCSLIALYGPNTGSPAVGDLVYLSDTGTFSLTPGTLKRIIGTVIASSGGTYTFEFTGTNIFSEDAFAKFLVNGSEPTLPNSVNIQSYPSTLEFITNADVVPIAIKRILGGLSDLLQFRDDTEVTRLNIDHNFNINSLNNLGISTITGATGINLSPGGLTNAFQFNGSGNLLINTLGANITAAGNLSIATTAGGTGLSFSPGSLPNAFQFNGSGNFLINTLGANVTAAGNLTIATTAGGTGLNLSPGGLSNAFQFNGSGDLLINTPGVDITAAGNLDIDTTAGGTGLSFGPGGLSNAFQFNGSGNFLINTLGANITGAGNLTIATTAGATSLTISPGGLSNTWQFDGSGNLSANATGAQKLFKTGTGDLTVGTELSSNLIFETNTTNRWQIASTGELQALGGNRAIQNVLNPVNDQDATTRLFVETSNAKLTCIAATTANITLSGTQTIDGIALVVGNRVLVKDQTSGEDNGLYVVQSGAWTRTRDADSSTKVTSGMRLYVESGTINGQNNFILTTLDPITLGTTALTFRVIPPGIQASQAIPVPENVVLTNSTRVAQTTLEGAAFYLRAPALVSKVIARITSSATSPTLAIAIYQAPNGNSGTVANKILTFQAINASATGTFTTATAAEGTQLLLQGTIYVLFGRDSGTGTCTLRTYSNAIMDVLATTGTIAAGTYPVLFSTAFAATAPPATFDPLTQATVSANDVNLVCRLLR